MKFQCGKCQKMYRIDFVQVCLKDLSFKCEQCDNKFLIKKNLTFSSTSKNSKIVCENCGSFIDESQETCTSCNLVVNKPHEDLKIDNYFYELYEVNKNGRLYDKNTGKKIGSSRIKTLVIAACFFISLATAASFFFLINRNNKTTEQQLSSIVEQLLPERQKDKEIQVILMKSGQTYYVKRIERDGPYLKIANNNGLLTEVLEKDVLQISKATIEKMK